MNDHHNNAEFQVNDALLKIFVSKSFCTSILKKTLNSRCLKVPCAIESSSTGYAAGVCGGN